MADVPRRLGSPRVIVVSFVSFPLAVADITNLDAAASQALRQSAGKAETRSRFPLLRIVNWFEWRKYEAEASAVVDWRITADPVLRASFLAAMANGFRLGPAVSNATRSGRPHPVRDARSRRGPRARHVGRLHSARIHARASASTLRAMQQIAPVRRRARGVAGFRCRTRNKTRELGASELSRSPLAAVRATAGHVPWAPSGIRARFGPPFRPKSCPRSAGLRSPRSADCREESWSGWWDSNPRPRAPKARALPLRYTPTRFVLRKRMCSLIPACRDGLHRSNRICWSPATATRRDRRRHGHIPDKRPHDTAPFDLPPLLASWRRHLTAQRMSPATLATYSAAVRGVDAFLATEQMPRVASSIRREHVEAFITNLLERWKPATAHNRYRALRAFFGWLVEEGEIPESPMDRMRPPRLPEEPPPVLREGDFRRLLESCERDKTFAGRRDDAILRVLIDTGARRGEVLGLRLEDVDLDQGLLRVTGKGSRTRFVPVGALTVRSLDRYIRARSKDPAASSPQLWLSRRGVLRESGLADLVRNRGREAGLTLRLHPHRFRHAYAHSMLAGGMQETDLMAVVGWRSREMVARYAAATRAERAIAAARKLSPVDRLGEPTR